MSRGRYAVPAALLACVGIFGLMAFSPSAAQADSTGSTIPSNVVAAPSYVPQGPGGYNPFTSTGPTNTSSDGLTYINLPDAFIAPGQALYAASCASCHGVDAYGTSLGPNLQGLGAGTVDFWVSTGRMPLAISSVQAIRKAPRFNRVQTLEIAAYVQSKTPGLGIAIPIVNLKGADLELGGSLFTLNCAACHTITGAGDALAGGAVAPGLHLATTSQIMEAIRSGPANMPHFSEGNLTNKEALDITAYVSEVIQHPVNRGGFGLGGVGPVGEGFVGLLVGVGLLMLICFWIGERT